MIPVYNCIQFLPETLRQVLLQDLGEANMEIVVIDDASTDGDIEALVKNLSGGRIRYIRQSVNVGSLKNFETCLSLSRGKYIHLLHGDDFPSPGYYHTMTDLFEKFPSAGAAFCRINFLNAEGKVTGIQPLERTDEGLVANWLEKISSRQRLQYCAVSVKRVVFETLGGFYGVNYGEDWEMWARIASRYDFAYSPMPLANYRRHSISISGNKKSSGQHISDILQVIPVILTYNREDKRRLIKRRALTWYARYTMTMAFSTWASSKDKNAALIHAVAAMRLVIYPYLWWRYLLLRIRMITFFIGTALIQIP
jgi:glycosyltransferase involved in cell wall biosynthesis